MTFWDPNYSFQLDGPDSNPDGPEKDRFKHSKDIDREDKTVSI